MIKTLTSFALSLGLVLALGCSSSSDEDSEAPTPAPAPSEALNFAAIHADDAGEKIPVTLDNYEVAESDLAFYNITKLIGMNTFFHFPTGAFDLNSQTVVRMNRDTYYSGAIIDTTQGATVTIPETNGRYLSVMVVQSDHYIDQVFLEPGTHEITSDWRHSATNVLVTPSEHGDEVNVRMRTLVTDWN